MAVKNFEASAVNLCNPPEVKALLEKLSKAEASRNKIQEEIKASNTVLTEKHEKLTKEVSDLQDKIRYAIEEHGSYQDTENERYGVQYASKTAVYGNLPSFKQHFPKFVELCVKESIDVQALKGQVKGNLITTEDLEKFKILTYDTGYSFYVR